MRLISSKSCREEEAGAAPGGDDGCCWSAGGTGAGKSRNEQPVSVYVEADAKALLGSTAANASDAA